MRNKKIYAISLFLVIALILLIATVSALTLTPASSSTLTGVIVLNVTGGGNEGNITNCSFYAKSASTANSSWVFLANHLNWSADGTGVNSYINGTFNSVGLEDSTDYIFNASCTNASSAQSTVVTSLITVDNTVPDAPTGLTPTSSASNSVTFGSTVNGRETTSCTLIFTGINPGNPTYSLTHTGDTCTSTALIVSDQTYNWYITATDGTQTTSSATQTILVDTQNPSGRATAIVESTGVAPELSVTKNVFQKEIIGIKVWVLLLIIVFITIIYFIVKD